MVLNQVLQPLQLKSFFFPVIKIDFIETTCSRNTSVAVVNMIRNRIDKRSEDSLLLVVIDRGRMTFYQKVRF